MKLRLALMGLLASTSLVHAGPRTPPRVEPLDNARLLCRYAHQGDQSFISCEDEEADVALIDGPIRIRRVPIYTLPMSEDDFARAEQLVDSVMCYGSMNCTATLLRPAGL